MTSWNRRHLLISSLALVVAQPFQTMAQTGPSIHVIKGRGCGCCTAWAKILKSEGFQVTEEERHPADLVQFKVAKRIPQQLHSCHTAEINGYVIEGHVPSSDIRRLIDEKPKAIGLSVPEMPYGSPGMGPENQREAYEVILFREDGSKEVFSSYEAAS